LKEKTLKIDVEDKVKVEGKDTENTCLGQGEG
jgi:hypothetical protein